MKIQETKKRAQGQHSPGGRLHGAHPALPESGIGPWPADGWGSALLKAREGPVPRNCAQQAAASSKGEVEDRRGVNQRRGDRGERQGHGRKRERKQGSVGGGRDGQLRPAAPALGMCHSTRRGVVSAEGRPAQEARGP